MRNAFAEEITAIAATDDKVVLLSGDIGNRLFDNFKEQAPEQFFNCGVAEANMMTVAAGMALSGLRPVVYTITPFITTRCLEQIRVDVCHHRAPVLIVGIGSGLSYASLGATHHSLEDIAFLRTLPGMTVLSPSDPLEVRSMLRAALELDGPSYIRMAKKGEPTLHSEVPKLDIGRSVTMRPGNTVCIVTTGVMVAVALEAADIAARQNIDVRVVNMHTIKPLDTAMLEQLHREFKTILTLEEHSKIGGLGGAIAEWACQLQNSPRICRLGTEDRFFDVAGNQEYLRKLHKLDARSVADTAISLAADEERD